MTTERALQMHRLALSVVRAKGITLLEGGATLLQYRYGRLTIFYRPSDGWLDVWFDGERAATHSVRAGHLGNSADRGCQGGGVTALNDRAPHRSPQGRIKR
jgi:hypothetical protein